MRHWTFFSVTSRRIFGTSISAGRVRWCCECVSFIFNLETYKKILSWSFLWDIFLVSMAVELYHFGSGCDIVLNSLLKINSLSQQTWEIDRCKQLQQYWRIFSTNWRTGGKFWALFNLGSCSSYSITNYVKILMFQFFGKVNRGNLKIVDVNY